MLSLLIKTEKKLFALVIASILAVGLRPWILVSSYVIDPRGNHTQRIYDDLLNGGSSEVQWVDQERDRWRCIIKDGFDYPYCGHELYLNNSLLEGVDLSQYSRMRIGLRYQGPGKTVRVFLRNYDPAYSHNDDLKSTKYNAIEFEKELLDENGYLELSLDDFSVADWWLQMHSIPLRHSYSDFKNIVIFEVQTGSGMNIGTHEFQLDRIEFERQIISTETWYLLIIVTWILSILAMLGHRIFSLKRELNRRRQKESELTQLNTLLDKQAKNMEMKAMRDPLTGAFNREGVEESLVEALNEWHNHGKRLSIILLDIDHFKQMNDTFGHAIGDKVLVEITALVTRNIRAVDKFARWGGEEFLLVCRDSELSETQILGEKLRLLIEQHTFCEQARVTASFGVATIGSGESLESLFKRADEALYQAKSLGRNRVQVSSA
jgi:diguanylate cyclase (GGDEF)-like protein